ncbi:MAG: hypothetical protein IJ180_02640 [Bacteroidales bacterium]|nr:hypothetical protein [Bacteroidales bacterium]
MQAQTIELQKYNIIQQIMNIDNSSLLNKVSKYITREEKKVATIEEKDDTSMTKEEFFAMIDERMQEYEKGNYYTFDSVEEMVQHFNNL